MNSGLEHLENIILRNCLREPAYLENCRDKFFKNEDFKKIFKTAKEFWESYKEAPSREQLKGAFKLANQEVPDDSINAVYSLDLSEYDEDWLNDQTETYITHMNMVNSLLDSFEYLKKTPVNSENIKEVNEKFKNLIVQRNNLDFSFDEGADFFNPEYHKQLSTSTFRTGFPFIDTVLGGGFSAKALYVFMGPPKVGKSLWLGNLAASASKMGHNVAIVTLEMNDRKYIKRLGANMLNIPIDTYGQFSQDEQGVKKKLNNIQYDNLSIPGQIWVKEFPTSQAGVPDLERYLRKVEESKGIKFKVIVVDYINILKNWRNANSENTYMKIKQIAEDLRGMAMENGWCIVTATQTKQSEFDSTDLSMNSAAESSGLVATVDGMFGIIQDPIMYSNREYKLKILANRDDGYKNSHKMFNVDYRYMRIWENEEPMHAE